MTARRIGILGGTFDPIHYGHLDAGQAAETALGLTEMFVIPSNIPPHRPQPVASGYHRFAMVALAVAGRPRWRASDMELVAGGTSFTAGTLGRFADAGYAPAELFFVIGADAFAEVSTWKDYPAFLDRAHFVVVSRPGLSASDIPTRLPGLAGRMRVATEQDVLAAPSIILVDSRTADVSATGIRDRCASKLSAAGLVPPSVLQHIAQHALYASLESSSHPAGRLHGQN